MKKLIIISLIAFSYTSCKKCLECGVDNSGNPLVTYCKGDPGYDCIKSGECDASDASGAEIKCINAK